MQRAVFAAVALALGAWTIVMCVLEPVLFDGWFIEQWHAQVGGGFADYVRQNWTGELVWGNPRIGQWLTYATYDLAWHVVLTPLFVLALFALLLVHLRGRWPDPRRDGRALLVLVALAVLGQPQLGPVLFYRPFTANYVVGLVVQLAWLVPYRFALARAPREDGSLAITLAKAAGMLVLGAIAGACNEHTGPALVVAAGIACVYLARDKRLRLWLVVGLVAFVAGYIAMMTAPAQATRYCGVGEGSLVERLGGRSPIATLQIVLGLVIGGRWMWLALAAAWLATRFRPAAPGPSRAVRREALLWIALGAAISLTLLLSPKQGDRLLFAGLAFASLGAAVLLDAFAAARPRLRFAITIVAAGAFGFALARSITIAARVSADAGARIAKLAAAPPSTIVSVPPLREPPSRWFVGDDLTSDSLRHHVAQIYRLTAIDLEGRASIPYQFAIRYELATDGTHTVRRFIPLNQCEARRAFDGEVATLRAQHGPALTTAELAIVPRAPILGGTALASSRWRAGGGPGAGTRIAPRATVSNELGTRYLSIERGGLDGPLDVTLVGPGDRILKLAPEDGRYPYKPWSPGTYWVIVCAGTDCYLADTVRHKNV